MGVGGGKSEEKSQPDFFLMSHFCPSQCQKQSRPDLYVPHLGVRPSPLRDRGDDGPRDGRVTELRLATTTAHHATGDSTPNRTDQRKQTLFSKHITPARPSSVCPGVSGDRLSESSRSVLIPLTQARLTSSHSPVWRGVGGASEDGRGQSPASPSLGPLHLLAPGPRAQLCLRQEAPASGQQIKLYFSLFYLEVHYVPGIQLHIMALTQQQWMPEAKLFGCYK